MSKEANLINTRVALFFESPIINPENLFQDFNVGMGNIFNRTPLVLPIPNDPNLYEVPIVQMGSDDGVYACNIARLRADFVHAGIGQTDFPGIKVGFIDEAKNFYNFFSQKNKIKRIGFVSRFFFEDKFQDATITNLINSDFKELHGGTVQEAYIRFVSKIKIDNFDVNNFTAVEKFFARISGVGEGIKGISIVRDFNTSPEISYSGKIDLASIENFINKSEELFRLDDIKKILWPTETN